LSQRFFLTEHNTMKAYRVSGGMAPRIFDFYIGLGEWSASHPGRFTSRERTPGNHWI